MKTKSTRWKMTWTEIVTSSLDLKERLSCCKATLEHISKERQLDSPEKKIS